MPSSSCSPWWCSRHSPPSSEGVPGCDPADHGGERRRARRGARAPRLRRVRPAAAGEVLMGTGTAETWAGVTFVAALALVLALVHLPLGGYLHRVPTSERDSRRRARRLPPRRGRRPRGAVLDRYARSVLAFSAVSVLVLYGLLRVQAHLPLSLGLAGVEPSQAWNTAVSFVTNTNWQSYSGETTMGHLAQMSGLAVQNFVSAAVGIAVAIALMRGPAPAAAPTSSATSGSTWSGSVSPCCCRPDRRRRCSWRSGACRISTARRRHHARGWPADHHRRAGRHAGGHQAARHQRRRVLQRQRRAPLREPHAAHATASRIFLILAHPLRPAARLRAR